MSELSGPAGGGHMRVSDADRDRTAEVLREAAGQGRISMDELDERLDRAYAAKTYADLAPVTHDLPQPGTVPAPLSATSPVSRIGGTPRNKFSVAILSGARRAGSWVLPSKYVSVAVMGGVELDLRDAQFSEPSVTVHAYAILGGIEITVPEDVEVDVSGIALLGGFDHKATSPGVPGAPCVHVVGFAMLGGVEVRRKGPKKPKKKKRGEIAEGGTPEAIGP